MPFSEVEEMPAQAGRGGGGEGRWGENRGVPQV